MKSVGDLIGALKSRQAEIATSLASGNASTWEIYQRMVGNFHGLQESMDILNKLLKDEDENE